MTAQHTDIAPDPAREKALTDFGAWLLAAVAYRHPHWPHPVLAELRALAGDPLRIGYVLEDLPSWLADHLSLPIAEPGQDTPDLLADIDTAFDIDGARMTLTTAELVARMAIAHPDRYGTWDARLLDDALRQRGVICCALPGRDRVGYWHEDISRAREMGVRR
jgi:hypothetical protein